MDGDPVAGPRAAHCALWTRGGRGLAPRASPRWDKSGSWQRGLPSPSCSRLPAHLFRREAGLADKHGDTGPPTLGKWYIAGDTCVLVTSRVLARKAVGRQVSQR